MLHCKWLNMKNSTKVVANWSGFRRLQSRYVVTVTIQSSY